MRSRLHYERACMTPQRNLRVAITPQGAPKSRNNFLLTLRVRRGSGNHHNPYMLSLMVIGLHRALLPIFIARKNRRNLGL